MLLLSLIYHKLEQHNRFPRISSDHFELRNRQFQIRRRRPGAKLREKEIRFAILKRLRKADPNLFSEMHYKLKYTPDGKICAVKV